MIGYRRHARRSALLASTAAFAAFALVTDAQAQQQQQAEDEDALALEEIVVTGSRIRRTSFEDIDQPAVVISSELFVQRGFTNVADALNEIPSFGGGVDGITTGSGQNVGQEFLDLFDLGTQRTLVVVNGRRFVPGNVLSSDPTGRVEGSQVDINNIPAALVERVESLSIGGAPIYGADALAGTVNIILKDDFEGIDLSFQYANRFNPTRVDNYSVNGTFGANFADGRGNVTASIQFEDQRGAVANDFPRLRNQATAFGNGGNEQIIGDEGRFNILEGPNGFLPAPTSGVPLPGFGVNVLQDQNGNVLTFPGNGGIGIFDPGTQVGTSAVFFEGGNGFDLNDFEEAILPVQRFVFSSTAHYDVSDNVRLFMETNFLNSSSADLISQSSSAFNTAFLNTQGQGSFGISVNNPFLSTGDQAILRDALDRQGLTEQETIFLNGINLGLLPEAGRNTVDTTTFRVVGGVQGDFEWIGRNFNYEMSFNFGRTVQFRNQTEVLGEQFFNAVDSIRLDESSLAQLTSQENLDLLLQSTNSQTINVIRNGAVATIAPTDARVGDIVCSVIANAPGPVDRDPNNPNGNTGITTNTPTPDPAVRGCTPLNLFVGPGNPQEAINFVSADAPSQGRINQADWVGFISGDLIELPAGWSQFSVGFERRREFGSFTAGGTLSNSFSRQPAIPNVPQQEIVSNEFMSEARIPVLNRDVGFNVINEALGGYELFTSLEFQGAYRRIDPSNGDAVNIYTAGGSLGMLEGDLKIRGNFTRSVRQPSIIELFAPPAQTFDQTGDPCDNRFINNAPNTNRKQNCLTRAREAGFDDAALVDADGDGQTALVLAPGDDEFQTPSVNAAIPLSTQGNENLNFEVGNSWTVGFIYQPSYVPGLTIGMDYIDISIRDVIVEPDFSFFTQDCFDNSNFANGQFQDSCNNFFRSGPTAPVDNTVISGFDIVAGSTGFQNSDTLELKAIQGQLRYEFDVAQAANLFGLTDGSQDLGSLSLNGTFYAPIVARDSAAGVPLQDDGRETNLVGTFGPGAFGALPELTFTFDVLYNLGRFDFFWRTTYQDSIAACVPRVEGDCDDTPSVANPLPFDLEHDASVGYQVLDSLFFRGGVDNIMGNRQSRAEQAFGGFGSTLGRRYYLRLDFRM